MVKYFKSVRIEIKLWRKFIYLINVVNSLDMLVSSQNKSGS